MSMTNNTQQARKNQRHFHRCWGLLESSKMVAFVVLSSSLLLLLQLPMPTNASHVINLTGANYEEATKGRTVFLKVRINMDLKKSEGRTLRTTMCAAAYSLRLDPFI